jgi:predicted PurR-regulated permease PerM
MSQPSSQVRRITWRSADVVRALGLGVLFLFLWKFFWLVHSALFLVLLAILIAIILNATASLLARWLPFHLSFLLVLGGFLAGLGYLLVRMIPQLVEQGTQVAAQMPNALNGVAGWYQSKTGAPPNPQLSADLNRQLSQFVARFVPVAFNLITTLLGSFVIIVLAAFLAAQPATYRELFLGVIPEDERPRWQRLYDEIGGMLRTWVIGKALTMLGIGIATYIGLILFGVPGALALAALAALMEFIPNFGPTLAAIPALVAAFSVQPALALYVAIFYFALQQVQNAITVPLVERRAVNIPPAALLVWQLMLAVGFGVIALFVATPLLAVIVVSVRILYFEPAQELREWDRREPDSPAPPPEPIVDGT